MAARRKQLANLAARETAVARGRLTFLVACAVVAASILLCVYIWQYTRMVEIQLAIKSLEDEIQEIGEELEYMRLQREKLARLERIDFTAQERLNMIVPGRANLRYLPVSPKR